MKSKWLYDAVALAGDALVAVGLWGIYWPLAPLGIGLLLLTLAGLGAWWESKRRQPSADDEI